MENGFFDTITSILPTVGKVVSSLLGGLTENGQVGYVGFFAPEDGQNNDLEKAVFTLEDNKVYLYNTATSKKDKVVFSTPTQEGVGGDTICIPGMSRSDLTPIFSNTVMGGDDRFALSASKKTQTNEESNESSITVYAANDHVVLNDLLHSTNGKIKLGHLLEIEMESALLCVVGLTAIAATSYSLSKVGHLHINVGNFNLDVINPPQRMENNRLYVTLPEPLPRQGVAAIEGRIEMFDHGFINDSRIEEIDQSDIQRLLKFKTQTMK